MVGVSSPNTIFTPSLNRMVQAVMMSSINIHSIFFNIPSSDLARAVRVFDALSMPFCMFQEGERGRGLTLQIIEYNLI
jgi:hypothetical protein